MNRKINNKSDFDFILRLIGADGASVGWVDANWELEIYTASKNFSYFAHNAFGEKLNCRDKDGEIQIVVDRHQFPIGELKADFTIDIPDDTFPDGSRHVEVREVATDIELVTDRGMAAEGVVITINVPYLKKGAVGDSTGADGAEDGTVAG